MSYKVVNNKSQTWLCWFLFSSFCLINPAGELSAQQFKQRSTQSTTVQGAPKQENRVALTDLDHRTRGLLAIANEVAVAPLDQPFMVYHRLLGCLNECHLDDDIRLFETWLNGHIPDAALGHFHPGQLLSLLSDLGLPLNTSIKLLSGRQVTALDLLKIERTRFDFPPKLPTTSEKMRGPEYGWLFKSFCRYIGPNELINKKWSVANAISTLIKNGRPDTIEAGSHELQGLSECLRVWDETQQPTNSDKSTIEHDTYELLRTFLFEQVQLHLSELDVNDQAYNNREDFATCVDEQNLCKLVTDLNKQAHFLEWALLLPVSADVDLSPALQRLDDLTRDVAFAVDESWTGRSFDRHAMLIAAASHARHAILPLLR